MTWSLRLYMHRRWAQVEIIEREIEKQRMQFITHGSSYTKYLLFSYQFGGLQSLQNQSVHMSNTPRR